MYFSGGLFDIVLAFTVISIITDSFIKKVGTWSIYDSPIKYLVVPFLVRNCLCMIRHFDMDVDGSSLNWLSSFVYCFRFFKLSFAVHGLLFCCFLLLVLEMERFFIIRVVDSTVWGIILWKPKQKKIKRRKIRKIGGGGFFIN